MPVFRIAGSEDLAILFWAEGFLFIEMRRRKETAARNDRIDQKS
jgi:hypothetical protein